MWIDPLGWECIKNKVEGTRREKRVQRLLEKIYGKENVLSERTLLDSAGKKVKDTETGTGRRIDFIVRGKNGKWRAIEVTSITANKDKQLAKEMRIRDKGGMWVRNKNTGELVEVDGISTVIRGK